MYMCIAAAVSFFGSQKKVALIKVILNNANGTEINCYEKKIHDLQETEKIQLPMFYHNQQQAKTTVSLLEEFKRPSLNSSQTTTKIIYNFINNKKELSILTFNCQSLKTHKHDLSDTVITKCNEHNLVLTETWMANDEHYDISRFQCVH